jgi:hypothetical protein
VNRLVFASSLGPSFVGVCSGRVITTWQEEGTNVLEVYFRGIDQSGVIWVRALSKRDVSTTARRQRKAGGAS